MYHQTVHRLAKPTKNDSCHPQYDYGTGLQL